MASEQSLCVSRCCWQPDTWCLGCHNDDIIKLLPQILPQNICVQILNKNTMEAIIPERTDLTFIVIQDVALPVVTQNKGLYRVTFL